MPRRLLLEGSDLDQLMARVRTEMGPGARIVKAERVRSGGIGGFFAREHFELTVEIPDAHSGPLTRGVAPTAVGIEALLDAADAADLSDSAADGVRSSVRLGPGDPALSTVGESFASVLDSVRQLAAGAGIEEAGDAASAPDDDVVITSGTAQKPRATSPEPDPRRVTFTALQPTVVTTRRGATAQELERIGVPAQLLAAVTGRAAPGTRFTLSELLSHVPRAPEILQRPGSVLVVAGTGAVTTSVSQVLAARLGLEEEQVALAGEFGVSTGRGRWVTTPVSARRLRDEAARTGVPLLVSLAVGSGRFHEADAVDLIEALAPDQLWAAIEADRAVEDTHRWLTALAHARRFDAIAAQRVALTSAPARILGLGIPVGLIDGLVASAPVWAAMLSEQLDDPAWD